MQNNSLHKLNNSLLVNIFQESIVLKEGGNI